MCHWIRCFKILYPPKKNVTFWEVSGRAFPIRFTFFGSFWKFCFHFFQELASDVASPSPRFWHFKIPKGTGIKLFFFKMREAVLNAFYVFCIFQKTRFFTKDIDIVGTAAKKGHFWDVRWPKRQGGWPKRNLPRSARSARSARPDGPAQPHLSRAGP